MKVKPLTALVLIALACLSFFMRTYRLAGVPPALYVDEASFGYNAYSILKTGRDEFGRVLPLYTRSTGGGKNPVQLYSVAGSVWAFGLNEFSVRLPSAVFGTAAVVFAYLLALEMFRSASAALLAALLLAVCPWNFHLSRVSFEAISLSAFLTAGAYFLLRSLRQPSRSFSAAALMGLTFYCYAPAFSFVPPFLLAFALINRRAVLARRRTYFAASVLLFLLLIPHFITSVKGHEQYRFMRIQLITQPENRDFILKLLKHERFPLTGWAEKNPLILSAAAFTRNYLSSYSRRFLFAEGDTSTRRQSVEGFGVLHRAELASILAGILLCIARRGPSEKLLLLWLLIYPAGPSFGVQWVPPMLRQVCALPVYSILSALGFVWFASLVKKTISKPGLWRAAGAVAAAALAALALTLLFNAASFFHAYFREYPRISANAWGYGAKESLILTEKIKDMYNCVVVDDGIPFVYINILFHLRYDPGKLLEEKTLRWNGPCRVGRIGDYIIAPPKPPPEGMRCLFISSSPLPFGRVVKSVRYPGAAPMYFVSVAP
ncbi:MAG: glycosyltransferase family 39 protein [bacterium]